MIYLRWPCVALLTLSLAALGLAQEHTKDSVDAIKKALAARTAVLIDVREKAEWDQGHLQGARLLPLSRLKEDPVQELPKDKAIYLHCAAGRRCLLAADILRKQGYDVRPLKDGYKDLLRQGFPKATE